MKMDTIGPPLFHIEDQLSTTKSMEKGNKMVWTITMKVFIKMGKKFKGYFNGNKVKINTNIKETLMHQVISKAKVFYCLIQGRLTQKNKG